MAIGVVAAVHNEVIVAGNAHPDATSGDKGRGSFAADSGAGRATLTFGS